MISSLVTPFLVFFETDLSVAWLIVETSIDVIFFIDIIFNFLSAYHNQIEELIDNPKIIACNYLKSWFFFDAIGVLPFHLLLNSSEDPASLAQLTRIPRIFRIAKTIK